MQVAIYLRIHNGKMKVWGKITKTRVPILAVRKPPTKIEEKPETVQQDLLEQIGDDHEN